MNAGIHSLILKIGWFDILIDCNEVPEWFAPIYQRYKNFLSPDTSNDVELQVFVLPTRQPSSYAENKLPHFTENGAIFHQPGWEGELDFSKRIGRVYPSSPFFVEEIDYFLRVACALQAFRSGGLLFHAAGIVRNGNAHIFFGHSGAGKTTIAQLSGGKNLLNDDLILLNPNSSTWMVYSTPFYNPTQVIPQYNLKAPLKGMYCLAQDQDVYLEDVSPGEALAEIIANIPVISANPEFTIALVTFCQGLLKDVAVSRLHFQKSDSFWQVIDKTE